MSDEKPKTGAKRAGKVSLHGLTPEKALGAALNTPLPPEERRGGDKADDQQDKPPKESRSK